jgi:hypothetical protein
MKTVETYVILALVLLVPAAVRAQSASAGAADIQSLTQATQGACNQGLTGTALAQCTSDVALAQTALAALAASDPTLTASITGTVSNTLAANAPLVTTVKGGVNTGLTAAKAVLPTSAAPYVADATLAVNAGETVVAGITGNGTSAAANAAVKSKISNGATAAIAAVKSNIKAK